MSPETRNRLNAMNKAFYEQTVPHFDATRQQPWVGWDRVLAALPTSRPLCVLDVGCGNGRFGVYLHQRGIVPLHYTGTDNSRPLLDTARPALHSIAQVDLVEADLLKRALPDGPFDVVVLFGVIHHVPGATQRLQLMRDLAARVAPGGVLAFAAWRFYDNPRFQKRTMDWPLGMDREHGDYLLDWRRGTVAQRYCHHVDNAEHDELVAATGLNEIARYRADGKDERTNQYSILSRPIGP